MELTGTYRACSAAWMCKNVLALTAEGHTTFGVRSRSVAQLPLSPERAAVIGLGIGSTAVQCHHRLRSTLINKIQKPAPATSRPPAGRPVSRRIRPGPAAGGWHCRIVRQHARPQLRLRAPRWRILRFRAEPVRRHGPRLIVRQVGDRLAFRLALHIGSRRRHRAWLAQFGVWSRASFGRRVGFRRAARQRAARSIFAGTWARGRFAFARRGG
jgi:hypothetical protein